MLSQGRAKAHEVARGIVLKSVGLGCGCCALFRCIIHEEKWILAYEIIVYLFLVLPC